MPSRAPPPWASSAIACAHGDLGDVPVALLSATALWTRRHARARALLGMPPSRPRFSLPQKKGCGGVRLPPGLPSHIYHRQRVWRPRSRPPARRGAWQSAARSTGSLLAHPGRPQQHIGRASSALPGRIWRTTRQAGAAPAAAQALQGACRVMHCAPETAGRALTAPGLSQRPGAQLKTGYPGKGAHL